MKISEADYIEWFGVKGMKWKNHVYVTKKSYDSYKRYSKKNYQAEKQRAAKRNSQKLAKERKEIESKFKNLNLKPTSKGKHSTTYKLNDTEYVVPKLNNYRSALSSKKEKELVKDYIKRMMSSSKKPSIDEANRLARNYAIQLRKHAISQANEQRSRVLSQIINANKAANNSVKFKKEQYIKANYSAAAYKKKQKKSKKVM